MDMKRREIIRADVLGFCMGVRAAMHKVEDAVAKAGDPDTDGEKRRVYTFGPLIHNEQVLNDLASRGVGQIDDPDQIEAGTVVIRAHGIEKKLYEQLRKNGLDVIDGTCPRVLRSMRTVEKYNGMGWHIFLFGDAAHGEIRALSGFADKVVVIENCDQAKPVSYTHLTLPTN